MARELRSSLEASLSPLKHPKMYFALTVLAASVVVSCGNTEKVHARDPGAGGSIEVSVGIVKIGRKPLARTLTVSSELVPFQEIDIYAKESGYIKDLPVDYGTHVQKGQLLATLEVAYHTARMAEFMEHPIYIRQRDPAPPVPFPQCGNIC